MLPVLSRSLLKNIITMRLNMQGPIGSEVLPQFLFEQRSKLWPEHNMTKDEQIVRESCHRLTMKLIASSTGVYSTYQAQHMSDEHCGMPQVNAASYLGTCACRARTPAALTSSREGRLPMSMLTTGKSPTSTKGIRRTQHWILSLSVVSNNFSVRSIHHFHP